MSNSAQHKFSYRVESNYGVTPTTGNFQLLPIVGTTLGLAKGSIESQTIRPDRQVEDLRHGNRQVGGEVSTELQWFAFDALLEAVFMGTWTADVLTPGSTRRSFSLLREYSDQAASGNVMPFQLFRGCEFNTLNLTLAPESLVKTVFGVFGRDYTNALTRPTGTGELPVSTNKPIDSFVGAVEIDSLPVASLSEISLTIENGIEPRFVLFDDKSNQPKVGRTRVKGSLTLYFEDASLLNAFNGEVVKQLAFQITDLNAHTYIVSLPRIVLTGGQPDVSGESDITISIPFTATYEPGAGHAISITRVA